MKDDERVCPSCGHEVLNWDIFCPGCDQVPWDTDAGRRIMKGRRRRHFWLTASPILALLVLISGVVIIGNIHLGRAMRYTREASDLTRLLEKGTWLSAMLEDAEPGTAVYEQIQASARQWVADQLPDLLTMVQDDRMSPVGRSMVVMGLGKLLRGSTRFAEVGAQERVRVIEILQPLVSSSEEPLRSAAIAALEQLEGR